LSLRLALIGLAFASSLGDCVDNVLLACGAKNFAAAEPEVTAPTAIAI
jgi:hypothetical protein